jgi:hypothetical protein
MFGAGQRVGGMQRSGLGLFQKGHILHRRLQL